MGRPKSAKRLKAAEIVKDHYRKGIAKRSLARRLFNANPGLYVDEEEARVYVRVETGAMGKKSHLSLVQKKGEVPGCEWDIPDSFINTANFQNYQLDGPAGIVIANDPHVGAHDKRALASMFEWMKANKASITHVVWSDFWDLYSLSSYFVDPNKPGYGKELSIGWKMWELADAAAGGCWQGIKEGNHDDRLERYIQKNAPQLNMLVPDIRDSIFKYTENGIHYIAGRRKIQAGKLLILHGHELKFSARVNPAYGLYNKTKASAICGHFHRASEHSATDVYGNLTTCWSTGCLCSLNQPYISEGEHDWVHGFAFVKLEADGSFHVDNFRIKDGKIY